MCLVVDKVPCSEKDGLIVKSYKILDNNWYPSLGYYTPYFGKKVINGWLFPSKSSKKQKFYFDEHINGGFIHSYYMKPKDSWIYSFEKVFSSYSFFVKA